MVQGNASFEPLLISNNEILRIKKHHLPPSASAEGQSAFLPKGQGAILIFRDNPKNGFLFQPKNYPSQTQHRPTGR